MTTILRVLLCAGLTTGTAHAAVFNVPSGNVSGLINAINQANADSQPDVINLAAGSIYVLTRSVDGANGLPAITSPLMLHGNGSVIQRGAGGVVPAFRILEVAAGQLSMNDLSLRNGQAAAGGCILNSGTLRVSNSVLSGNTATGQSGLGGFGGAILNSGTLVFMNSTAFRNSARVGGGIANVEFGVARVTNSAVNGNSADFGGGIANSLGGVVTVSNSLLSRNTSGSAGGAIDNFSASTRLINSTVSANSASACGGINNEDGSVGIINSTLSDNSSGICNFQFANIAVTNSLIVNSDSGPDCASDDLLNAGGNNLDSDGSCVSLQTGGGTFAQVSPAQLKLGFLALNGGPGRTHALLQGSVAIDAGDQAECTSRRILLDQRGSRRPFDGNDDGTAICDIGAFEFGPASSRCGDQLVTIFGTNGNDRLFGTAARDVVRAYGGNDTIIGLGGRDLICGGLGHDVIAGGLGENTLFGENGNDRLLGSLENDQLFGGPNRDRLLGGPGQDALDGGLGVDSCNGGLPGLGDVAVGCETMINFP